MTSHRSRILIMGAKWLSPEFELIAITGNDDPTRPRRGQLLRELMRVSTRMTFHRVQVFYQQSTTITSNRAIPVQEMVQVSFG
jgi:hypothetical protein